MTMGLMTTVFLAIVIGGVFLIGMRRLVRKFTKGESDCCSSTACGSCQCHCAEKKA